MNEKWPNPIKTYFETIDMLKATIKEYPTFRKMWEKDIKNEFIKEYKKDEIVKLYSSELQIIEKIAEKAAHNFFEELLKD